MTATRTLLGMVVLAGERLQIIERINPNSAFAIAVGLAGHGADAAKRATRQVRQFAPKPPTAVKKALDDAGRRGILTVIAGKRDAQRLLSEVIDDILDDIATDRRIRALVTEQSNGMPGDMPGDMAGDMAGDIAVDPMNEEVEPTLGGMFTHHEP